MIGFFISLLKSGHYHQQPGHTVTPPPLVAI
jgi:hypothetical protein